MTKGSSPRHKKEKGGGRHKKVDWSFIVETNGNLEARIKGKFFFGFVKYKGGNIP